MASGVADAIFIRQLLEEIQEHIGIKTFLISDKRPVSGRPLPSIIGITVLTDSTSATSLVQRIASIVDVSTSSLDFFGCWIITKIESSKLDEFLLKTILPTSLPKMCQHLLRPDAFLLVPFKNFVSKRGVTTTTTSSTSCPTPSPGRVFNYNIKHRKHVKHYQRKHNKQTKKKTLATTSLTS